jgi:hypothetical protein
MANRCPTCGAAVASIFEHVDVDCRPIADAPHDGRVILGLYSRDERWTIRWADHRSHPGGGGSCGAGWVDEEMSYPAGAPEAWAETS